MAATAEVATRIKGADRIQLMQEAAHGDMMTVTAEVARNVGLEEVSTEDRARAALYGLIANLFCAAPSAALLRVVVDAGDVDLEAAGSGFARAWRELQRATATADIPAVRQEFDDVFISTGLAPVSLYSSSYFPGVMTNRPLAGLRDELAALGLARKRESGDTEDHIAALCDVMRFLIAGDAETHPASLAVQRDFFMRNIAPWYRRFCEAVERAEQTRYYRAVAAFVREFFDLEVESFDIA